MFWTEQDDGSWIGAASERAVEWSGDDQHKLAAIGFAAWCKEMKLDPFWESINWGVTTIDYHVINVRLDTSEAFDKFVTYDALPNHQYVGIRVLDGNNPVVSILGFSGQLDQLQTRFPDGIPTSQLLSCKEWLRLFPIHHANPEAA